MATETTIYPSGDTFLREDIPATNYGTSTLLRVGQFSSTNRRHGLFAFDCSAFTAPSRIVSSVLTLTEQNTFGTTTRTMKLCRNTQTATNTATATWATYDGSTAWSDGGEADSAQTEPMYSVSVGNSVGNAVVDINDLVIDAVTRRSNELDMILCFDKTDTNTASIGNSVFYSVDWGTVSQRPKLVVKVADVVRWTGDAGDNNADTARNWTKLSTGSSGLPTNNDYVIFNDGNADVLSGTINCDSMFISEGYTGNIGTSSTAITIQSDGDRVIKADKKIVINKKSGIFNLQQSALTTQSLYISNCPEGCKYSATLGFDCYISRTSGEVEIVCGGNALDKTEVVTTGRDASRIKTSGVAPAIKAVNGRITLDNGCYDFVLCNSNMFCSSGNIAQSGTSYIMDGSAVTFLGSETGADINIMNGTLTFKDNQNASITTEDLLLWKNGFFDPRTEVGAWNNTASPSIDCRGGGKFIVDSGRTLTVT
jgi:hypothetical protein